MTHQEKSAHLVAKWRDIALAHGQYTGASDPALAAHAKAKRDIYNLCAEQLERLLKGQR